MGMVYVPAADGAPLIRPEVALRDNPAGKPDALYVIGAVPEAVIV